MDYIRVANAADIAPGEIKPIEAGGKKLLLANDAGTLRAAQRKCPHMGFNLCRGKIDDGAVVCPLHKAKFDLESGRVERDPKLLFINMKSKSDLAVYPVKVEDGAVFVGI